MMNSFINALDLTNIVALNLTYGSFYCSRQRYVLGDTAMQRMSKSNVLLCGIGGLGVEIGRFLCIWKSES